MPKQRELESYDHNDDLGGVDEQGLDDALQSIPIGEPAVVRRVETTFFFEPAEVDDDDDYPPPPAPPRRRRSIFSVSRRSR